MKVQLKIRFLREGGFDAQNLATIPHADMLAKQSADAAAQRAAAVARDDADAAERVFDEAIVGAKLAVKAQYGKDANEVQAIGYKKSSEIRRGRRAPDATNKSA